jgi:F-type H+-transporting ATPase subunit epsilon
MFKLDFVTPESKIAIDQDLHEITLPAERGELNILPGHAPLMTTLRPGILTYKLTNGESGRYAISWGYCQVSERGVSVLAETAVTATEVNVKADQDQLKQFESRLMNESLEDQDWELVQNEIARLKVELEIAGSAR